MDDIVVIILTLLVAAFGIIGQIKKKKPIANPPANSNNKEDFWDLLVGENEIPGAVQQNTVPEQQIIDQISHSEISEPFNDKKENPKAEKEETKKQTSIKAELKSVDNDKFSLKKAIIYSEILNNKYT